MPLVPVKKIDDRGTVYDIEVAMDDQVTEEGIKPVKGSGIYDFVNSSVATNTANFVGTYDSLEALEEHADYQEPLTNNDYGFVVGTDAAGNTIYSRYKYNSENEEWMFEYNLNNSSFTANQWETINSGLTSTDKQQIATNTNDIATLKVNAKDYAKQVALALPYDSTQTYVTGDLVTLDGYLYRCDPTGTPMIIGNNLFDPVTVKEGPKYVDDKITYGGYGGWANQTQEGWYSGTVAITSGKKYKLVLPFSTYLKSNQPIESVTISSISAANPESRLQHNAQGEINFTANAGYICISVEEVNENKVELYETAGNTLWKKVTVDTLLDEKENTLTFDDTPTLNSNNPVKSNGIAVGLNEKYNTADMVPTTWEEWNAMGDEKYTDHKLYFIPGEDDPQPYKVYGFHIDPTESDPDACVSYLEDAIGMTPASMGATEFSYGTWGNAFFMPKPCMVKSDGTVDYYLDPNDYTKKEDGTASDVANASYDGNAMMEWPLIYYKYEAGLTDGEGYFYCSNYKIDNSYHCWCNYDCDGNIIPHFYTAIYNGTGTTKLRSISGVTLNSSSGCGGTTGQQEIDRATANNTTTGKVEWYTGVFSDRMLINGLLILISKNLNCQAAFGNGLVTGSQSAIESYVTGSLNDKGLFWGDITNQNKGVKVFGMENWWGCVWHRTAGCVGLSNGTYAIKQTWSTVDGTTSTGYNSNGTGYINAGTRPDNSGQYIKQCTYGNDCYLPSVTTGASSTTYYCDYWYTNNSSLTYLLVGGNSYYGVYAGFSYFALDSAFAAAYWAIGVCLSLKPLANPSRL